MQPSAKSTPSLNYFPNSGASSTSGMHTSESWHGGAPVAHSHQNLSLEQGGVAHPAQQPRGMPKSYSYSNARDRPPSWDGHPPPQRRSYGSVSDQIKENDLGRMMNSSQDIRHPYPHQRSHQQGYSNNYENMNEFLQNRGEHSASGLPNMGDRSYGGNQWQSTSVAHEELAAQGATGSSVLGGERRSPSPPLPPVRDSSSLKYIKVSQSHEKYPSWPVTANQNQSAKPMNNRTNSWSEHTQTVSEFPSKPKMAYNPALTTHTEERLETSDSARQYFEDNGVKTHEKQDSDFHKAVVNKLQGDLDIRHKFPINSHGELDVKNFKNDHLSYPHPTYDKDGKIKDIDKDYAVPSPPERDIPSEQQHRLLDQVTSEPSGQWNQYSGHPGASKGDQTSPLVTNAPPPPPTHTASATTDPSQSFTSNVQVMLGSPAGSGYPLIVKSRPFYNTSTQTDVETEGSTDLGRKAPQREEKSVQVRQQSLLAGVNFDEIMDNNNKSTAPAVSPTSTTMVNIATSPKESSPGLSFNHFQPQSREHRSAPIVDRLQQEKRIPETISENEEAKPSMNKFGLRNELERIHEHSPSQTTMLRKLSQELYYGQQTRYGMGMTNRMYHDRGRERKGSGDNPLTETPRPPDLTLQPPPAANTVPASPGEQQEQSPESPQSPQVSPFERGNKVQMSLRKAYGIFDEIENYDPASGRKNFGKHAKSASTSQMPSTVTVGHKSQSSLDGRGNYADYVDINKAKQQWQKNQQNSGSDTHVIAEQARQDWTESGKYKAYENANSTGRLKRTTSEQIRPIKERLHMDPKNEQFFLRKENKHKLSDPESAQEKRHKISDPLPYSEATGSGDRSSDPTSGGLTFREKRLSDSSDVFRNVGRHEVNRRISGARSNSSTSSMEERNKSSDPDLKKYQHHALMSFYEKKTGKRLSSSSMDSSISGGERSVIKAHSPSPQRPADLKKAFSLPRDAIPPPGEEQRRLSSTTEGELSPPLLLDTTSPGDRSSYHSRTSSLSVTSPGADYSPPLHPWGQHAAHDQKRNPLFGTPMKSAGSGSIETSPASVRILCIWLTQLVFCI